MRVAPGLVPMQDETEIVAGKATLSSIQTLHEEGNPNASIAFNLATSSLTLEANR